jgi:hypothetical protein
MNETMNMVKATRFTALSMIGLECELINQWIKSFDKATGNQELCQGLALPYIAAEMKTNLIFEVRIASRTLETVLNDF